MATVAVKINGASPGPNLDLPFFAPVTLTNNDNTGVLTWAWTFFSRPAASTATLSGATTNTATFTPDVEGTYIVQLVVNAATTPVVGTVAAATLLVKTRQRIPGTRETNQAGAAGWADSSPGMDSFLRAIDSWRADPNVIIGVIDGAETPSDLALYKVFAINGSVTILPTLPGEQLVPKLHLARATAAANFISRPVYIVTAVVDGTSIGVSKLCVFKRAGLVQGITALGGATLDQEVYVSDTGALSLSLGTAPRVVGRIVVLGGGFMSVAFDGSMIPGIIEANFIASLSDIFLLDPGASDQHVVKGAGTGKLVVGTVVSTALQFETNSTVKWQILATGTLKSSESTNGYPIQNVADPVDPLDVVNKRTLGSYLFETILQWGAASTPNANGTTYLFPSFGNAVSDAVERLTPYPGGGSSNAVYMSVHTTGGLVGTGATITCTFRINSNPSLLKVVLNEGDQSGSGSSSAPLFQNDALSVDVVSAGGVTTGLTNIVVTVAIRQAILAP